MQISPRYDGPAIVVMDGAADDQAVPTARQRNRLGSLLAGLSAAEWATASRCDGWTVQDVVAHLVGVNQFFEFSVRGGLAGAPTKMLQNFDPVATPSAGVQSMKGQTPAAVLAQYVESNRSFLAAINGLTDAQWMMTAESPAGHVPLRYVAQHALWDCWTHERDIAIPLGRTPEIEQDELLSCLRYAAAISPALALGSGHAITGTFTVVTTDPVVTLVVDVSDVVAVRADRAPAEAPLLQGSAVEVVEALTIRAPMPPTTPPEWRHLLTGLATAFDTVPQ